jgi:hypothetical protein
MRIRLIVLTSLVLLVAGAAVALAKVGTAGPSGQSLSALQNTINSQLGVLRRRGVLVDHTALSGSCIRLAVINPTQPNVDYLNRRFGGRLCIDTMQTPAVECAPRRPNAATGEEVLVPDVRQLGLYEAEKRLLASGFAFSTRCVGVAQRTAKQPPLGSAEALVRITRQCPAAGEQAVEGSSVVLQADAVLPGGFKYAISPFLASGETSC